MPPIEMADSAQETSSHEPLPGTQFFSGLLLHGVLQFQEALIDGNPLAVATVGVVSFLLLTVVAQCTYSLRFKSPDTKKSNRRRRKNGGGGNASQESPENSQVSEKRRKQKKAGSEGAACSVTVAATAEKEKRCQLAEVDKSQNDGGGEWLVVSSKKRAKPKTA